MMNENIFDSRPKLKTRGFSTFHLEIFELILLGKTNREINQMMGYTPKSHVVVDHSRRVMYKILAMEGLCKKDNADRVSYPREYCFWWKKLLDKHSEQLHRAAIAPVFYETGN